MIRCTLSLLSLYLSPLKIKQKRNSILYTYLCCFSFFFAYVPLETALNITPNKTTKEMLCTMMMIVGWCCCCCCFCWFCCCRMLFLNGGKIVVPFLSTKSIRIRKHCIQNNIILIFMLCLSGFFTFFFLFNINYMSIFLCLLNTKKNPGTQKNIQLFNYSWQKEKRKFFFCSRIPTKLKFFTF